MPIPPQKTDVLIVGSGSAGLFASIWLSQTSIPFTILERRNGPLQIGQADGVQCRTVEIYESFGISEELLRESYHVLEVAFWGPAGEKGIERKRRSADTEGGVSHCPHVILNQARMNALAMGVVERNVQRRREESKGKGEARQGVQYGWEVKSVSVDEKRVGDPNAYCVRVEAEREGLRQVWEAKYVLGCDGAHSTVRHSLGYRMIGDTSDTVWGVMDIFPRTNFPDIRRKCTIHSSSGNLLIIPREGGSMVRFYIQLPAGSQAKAVKLADLQTTAKKIFQPYDMEIAETFWWSAYSIGQRLAEQFHKGYRVFLTGDACHTHSPKAGQGMNVSLQDGYNLGWKLCQVLKGLSPPSLLKTYVLERSKTAKDLIEFDRELARMFSSKEDPEVFAKYFVKSGRYMAGLTARYEDSEITDRKQSKEEVAKQVVVGMRFPSAQVVRFCDCKAVQLLSVLRSDGRWRVVIFGGDIVGRKREAKRLEELATFLEGLVRRYTPSTADIDSLIEPIVLLSSKFAKLQQEQIPQYFWPVTGKWRMRDLHKVYVDDEHYNAGHGHAYERYGVEPMVGAVVIVRPDQYVAKVTTLDEHDGIVRFFKGLFIERGETSPSVKL
ncbi:2-polyprenyl-6-methoxyphenol hydroxylase [Westerdykella ornata]|uniref:2-polyprenyl-6-methoxyphenol hydroxylase n=1 Tax=Westerdykella ornata TaxID=318751 RepID=A0A6A6JIQ0_WESOR|nr:2-polyprenyl-6-methoxyphenol hydroxylase [Westerdykella ornata]KAF2276312.1 2-polyprenyl-6-methoxyphenol hydroxylase [Westerdykella ornata]